MNDIDKSQIERKIPSSSEVQILDIFIIFCQSLKEQVFPVLSNLFESMVKYGKFLMLFYGPRMAVTKFYFVLFIKIKNTFT